MDAAIADSEKRISDIERLVWDAIYALQKMGHDIEATKLRRRREYAAISVLGVTFRIYLPVMLPSVDIAEEISKQRKAAGLSRVELAMLALASRSL